MRSILDIHNDIEAVQVKLKDLREEKSQFQANCPHPEAFVTRSTYDVEDDCLGAPIYEYTVVTYECSLCTGRFSVDYNRESSGFSDNPPPTLEEVLKKK